MRLELKSLSLIPGRLSLFRVNFFLNVDIKYIQSLITGGFYFPESK